MAFRYLSSVVLRQSRSHVAAAEALAAVTSAKQIPEQSRFAHSLHAFHKAVIIAAYGSASQARLLMRT